MDVVGVGPPLRCGRLRGPQGGSVPQSRRAVCILSGGGRALAVRGGRGAVWEVGRADGPRIGPQWAQTAVGTNSWAPCCVCDW